MDRRMYRGNMGNNYRGQRGVAPYRPQESCCDDLIGGRYKSDDNCDRKLDNCEENFDPDRFPIGMCYVPWQCFRDLYDNEFVALKNGTIFKELDMDWYGRGCK